MVGCCYRETSMTDKLIKLSDTGRAMLTLASTREDRLVYPPTLPGAAARQVVRSLLVAGTIEEVTAPVDEAGLFWGAADDGTQFVLRATDIGLSVIGPAAEIAVQPILVPKGDHGAYQQLSAGAGEAVFGAPQAGPAAESVAGS